MKNVLFIGPNVPQDKMAEGVAVYTAVVTGKCNICGYLTQCEKGEDFEFPKDAACMQILNSSKS